MGSLRAAAFLAVFLLAAVGSAGGAEPPFRPTGGLAFGPAAPVDPAGTSVQPNLALGDDGTIWLSSSTIGQTVFVRRSSDDGRSFRVAALLPVVTVDAGGTIYAVWVDQNDHNVYYAASPDAGASWRGPVRVNGNE